MLNFICKLTAVVYLLQYSFYSTYSFGGFSLGEFHEEDTTYNNDPYSTINQKNCAVAMNQWHLLFLQVKKMWQPI